MQQVQWYPGHMHKASKEIKQKLPEVDLIIEVLDARIPFSSQNPMIASLRGDKPTIKVLSKSDLADPQRTEIWQAYLERNKGVKTLPISTEDPSKMLQLPNLIRKMLPNKEGSAKKIQAMIMGIPNVGKSTLINTLMGRIVAKAGNEPAVTKGQQQINLADDIVLWDTPGVTWGNIENKNTGYRLATTGAIRDTAIDHEDIACYAAEFLLNNYPQRVQERYSLIHLPESEVELLDCIASRRGCLRGGGHTDFDKVSKILLNEVRSGTLGPLTFELPAEMENELIELAQQQEEKAAKKETRKKRRKGSR
jgi:ribosome biogenesis GTPase A